jgi:hypothetical protein
MREPPFSGAQPASRRFASACCRDLWAVARASQPQGYRAGVPVICIGNPTLGGAGKTPTALAVARMLQAAGERPVFLSWAMAAPARPACGLPTRIAPPTSATSRSRWPRGADSRCP